MVTSQAQGCSIALANVIQTIPFWVIMIIHLSVNTGLDQTVIYACCHGYSVHQKSENNTHLPANQKRVFHNNNNKVNDVRESLLFQMFINESSANEYL